MAGLAAGSTRSRMTMCDIIRPQRRILSIQVSLPIEVLIWSAKMLAPGCALGTIQAV